MSDIPVKYYLVGSPVFQVQGDINNEKLNIATINILSFNGMIG